MTKHITKTKEFQNWLHSCQNMVESNFKQRFPNVEPSILIFNRGRRYTKIVEVREGGKGQQCVFAFIDRNGDVLLPASWTAPAKHARGNIFDDDNGLGSMTPYGPAYLR